jgi:cytosine/adenosine deaminase-related metal-dependent hydrolase
MEGAVIEDGGVLIAKGRIVSLGRAGELRQKNPRAQVEEFSDSILTPGLVNAHTHLELSDFKQCPAPSSFGDWLMRLVAQSNRPGDSMPRTVARGVEVGVAQSLRFGVTTVGDISKQCMFSRPALAKTPLRAVSYGEIQAMAGRRILLEERLAVAADQTYRSERLIIGLTPHAPYTVEPEGYRKCLEYSRAHGTPLATHLAENAQEAEFLAHHTGQFRELWEVGVKAWDDRVPKYAGGPIRLARDLGLIDHPTLLAHVNYCDDDELAILAGGRASVVYCPRTHAYFGHPPHRWREMLSRGINVAVGTDSCASSPDLNLLDDLRLLRRLAPDVPAVELWKMATIRAARAIRMEHQVGSLAPGKRADLAAWPAGGEGALSDLLDKAVLPTRVWIDGAAVTTWRA